MRSTADWPEVKAFEDHWSWRPDWTPDRPRLLWYLTFEDRPQLREAAAPFQDRLRAAGADVVPPCWLHLTLTDLGFRDRVDDRCREAVTTAVRDSLLGHPPLDLRLGPIGVLPGAVVLAAHPGGRLDGLRHRVRRAAADAGWVPCEDIHREFWPHVSLCYVNRRTDHEALFSAVRSARRLEVRVRCDRLTLSLVTRRHGHYRWEVVEQVPLGASTGRSEPAHA